MSEQIIAGSYWSDRRGQLVVVTKVDATHTYFKKDDGWGSGLCPSNRFLQEFKPAMNPNLYRKALEDIRAELPKKLALPLTRSIRDIVNAALGPDVEGQVDD